MQEIRDKVLSLLSSNMTAEQLQMVDLAVAEALQGYKVIKEETLPAPQTFGIPPEVAEYLARKKSKGLQPESIEQYSYVLKSFFLYTQKNIHDICEGDIRKFLDAYETFKGIKRRRKAGMRVILNGFFRYLNETGRIRCNPMSGVEPIKFDKRVREALTDLEFTRLRRACETPRERAIVEFLFATGCRVSELTNLNRSDIDFENRQVKVFGKESKERFVFLNASAIIALDEYFKSRSDSNDALFVSSRHPFQRIKKRAVENEVRQVGERANILKRVIPHILRHTTATYLLRHGMLLEDVQDYLGHESVDTTRIYAKSDPDALKNSYKRCMAA